MGFLTACRRRQIRKKGRTMQLPTLDKSKNVMVMGYAAPPTAATIDATVPVQAFVAQIMNDELAASSYGAPKIKDRLYDGVRIYTLTDATPIYDGPDLCGWTLIAAGGS